MINWQTLYRLEPFTLRGFYPLMILTPSQILTVESQNPPSSCVKSLALQQQSTFLGSTQLLFH